MNSTRSTLSNDVRLRVVSAGQVVLAIFALVIAGLCYLWYLDTLYVATERPVRVIAKLVQKEIDPNHPDLNNPRLLATLHDALKLDYSIYMIALLDRDGRIVNAVGESAPYAKGFDFYEHILDPTNGTTNATVLIRATSNPLERALNQSSVHIIIAAITIWAFCAYLLRMLLHLAMSQTFFAGQQLASQCISLLKNKGLHPKTRDLPLLLTSARTALVEAEELTKAEVAARTRALREAYDLNLESALSDSKHLRRVDEAIEMERGRIALEIHDSLNAQTVALRLYASAIKTRASSYGDPQIVDLSDKLSEEMKALFETARTIVRDLRPELLDSVGLVGALTQLATTLNIGTTECNLNISTEAYHNISKEQVSALFRVAQEATTNAQRHSGATRIDIELLSASLPWHCRLMVSDNGHGFDTSRQTPSTKGLKGMKQRASAVDGICSVASSPYGTVITMIV